MPSQIPASQPPVTALEAWAYCRFSTPAQALGDSRRRQTHNAETWCVAKGRTPRYLVDEGISAFRGKNTVEGQFRDFLEAIRAKKLGREPVLLIENLDRMSRQIVEISTVLFLELINAGATIVTLHNAKSYATGMTLVDVWMAMSEMYAAHEFSAKISERVTAAVEERWQAGKIIHTGSSTPGWLTLDARRTHFAPITKRAAVVVEMFDRAGKGMGGEAIARALNARKEPMWTKSKHWTGTAVRQILHNRSVLGEYDGRPGYFGDRIVTDAQWAAVNSGACRAAHGRGNGVIKELNLLTGFTYSGLDNSRMILRSSGIKKKDGQYVWHTYLVSNDTIAGISAQRHRVKYSLVEDRVLWLASNLDPTFLERAREGSHDDTWDRTTELRDRVAALEKQVGKLTRLILKDDNPSASLVTELKRHESELAEAVATLAGAERAAAKAMPLPQIPIEEDIQHPEVRRALRKQLAQWCIKLEVFQDHLIWWFSERHGMALNLVGQPKAWPHDLDNVELEELITELAVEESLQPPAAAA